MKTHDIAGAAKILHVSPYTMRELASSGKIKGAKIGRSWVFTQDDLEQSLRAEIDRQTAARGAGKAKIPTTANRLGRPRKVVPALPSAILEGAHASN